MICLQCAHNRPVRVSPTFYGARCRLGYDHAPHGCEGFVERPPALDEPMPSSKDEILAIAQNFS